MQRFFLFLGALFLLSACSSVTTHPVSKVSAKSHASNQQALRTLNTWRLQGKMAVLTPSERSSVFVDWYQQDDKFELNLSTHLGIQVARLTDNGTQAILLADGQRYVGNSAQQLLLEVLQWPIPVQQIKHWVKAQILDGDAVNYEANGFVRQLVPACLECRTWTISYGDYTFIDKVYLPSSITISNAQQTTIKFKIQKWQLNP